MSVASTLAPLLATGALSAALGVLHRRVPPAIAARSLTAALLLVTVAAIPSIWLLGFGFLSHLPALGHLVDWCTSTVSMNDHVPPYVGVPAVVAGMVGMVRVGQVANSYRRLRDAHDSGVEVAGDRLPIAYTRPGPGGRIVISSGLISMLTADELDVVLAHERSHRTHRHDRMVFVAQMARAIVPVLHPVTERLRFSIERWADEDTVTATGGDRRFVARTIAKVALGTTAPEPALAVAELGVPARVALLLDPPTSRRRLAPLVAVWCTVAVSLAMAGFQLHHVAALLSSLCPG